MVTGIVDVLLISLIILLTFLQVLSRYVFNWSIPWAQELTVFSMVYLVLLGCSMGMKKHEVASLTLLLDRLPFVARQIMRIVDDLIMIAFLAIMIGVNQDVIANSMGRLSGMMRIPMGFVNIALTLSAALIIIHSLVDIWDIILSIRNYRKEDENQ